MRNSLKVNEEYLSQFKNNQNEKVFFWIKEIEQYLKKSYKQYNFLEIGPGSGHTIKFLKDTYKDKINITAVDTYPEILESIQSRIDVSTSNACLAKLPFKNDHFDGINASSVFHEIYSYGLQTDNDYIHKTKAIIECFREFCRVLKPNGLMFYRDVLSPSNIFTINKKVHYRKKSWMYFIPWFVEYFLDQPLLDYDVNQIKIVKLKNEEMIINSPVGFHKEIQKHYINFTHHIKYILGKDLGFSISEKLIGSMSYEVIFLNQSIKKYFNNHRLVEDKRKHLIASAIEVDDFIDNLVCAIFSNKEFRGIRKKLDDWINREGKESYAYLSCLEILEILKTIRIDSTYLNIGEDNGCINYLRPEYNFYLRRVIDDPELDGTQILLLRKFIV